MLRRVGMGLLRVGRCHGRASARGEPAPSAWRVGRRSGSPGPGGGTIGGIAFTREARGRNRLLRRVLAGGGTPALLLVAVLLGAGAIPGVTAAQGGDMIPLPQKLPKPVFAGTPSNAPAGSNVEKPLGKPRPIPLVPKGTTNLALHKKVTASKPPFAGALELVTD